MLAFSVGRVGSVRARRLYRGRELQRADLLVPAVSFGLLSPEALLKTSFDALLFLLKVFLPLFSS